MYRLFDRELMLVNLNDDEYKTVLEIVDKGRNGTATMEEIELAEKLMDKNDAAFGELPPDEELRKLIDEEEKKMRENGEIH